MSIDKSTLLAAFNMPPEQAVEFLRSKGLQVSESWRDLWQTAHRRAFTVARSAGYDVLEDIRSALVESMSKGESYQQFIDKLTPTLQAKGWWGKEIDYETGEITVYPGTSRPVELGSPRRLKLIYEQNMQTAFQAGRWRGMKAATATHPFWRYVAVLDNRTRPTHRAMHGRVFRHDDAGWSVAYPPNGWKCRCRAQPLTASAVRRNGYEVEAAASLGAGRERLRGASFDALLLDLMLPDGDGLDLTRELRADARLRRLPLLMLTARGEPMDRIVGLELGADDYLPKPFEPRELLARVKALLRRASPEPGRDDVLVFGRLEIDLGARQARLDGKSCDLTGHQFELLVVLAKSPGRVLSRDQIMDALKGHPLEAFDRSIDVHISRIRAVIEDDPKNPKRVLTVRGSGYVFARKQDE